MTYFPVIVLKYPNEVKSIIEEIDSLIHLKSNNNKQYLINIKNINTTKNLIKSDMKSYKSDFSDINLENEVKKYVKVKSLFRSDLPEARTKYSSYSLAANISQNRFSNSSRNIIKGVGFDGSGEHPKNYKQEKTTIEEIEAGARKEQKWNTDYEDLLRESIANTIYWQSSNFRQLAIGTPVQVVSAIIELINCEVQEGNGYKYRNSINGQILVSKRPECSGLKLLLEGNKFDLDEGINAKQKFLDHVFRRLFYSDKPSEKGIFLKVGASSADKTGTGYELCTDSKENLMGLDFYKNLLSLLNGGMTDKNEEKKTKFGAILLIYSICFSYIAYINNLY